MPTPITPSPWRAPDLSMRWWPVFLRNLLVWRKLAVPSLLGNIAEPLMWLVAFGYGMGALVGQVQVGGQNVPYILFLASGSICMSAMNAASFEALYSAFSRMHVQKTWDGIMNAPISLDSVLLAEMLWADNAHTTRNNGGVNARYAESDVFTCGSDGGLCGICRRDRPNRLQQRQATPRDGAIIL